MVLYDAFLCPILDHIFFLLSFFDPKVKKGLELRKETLKNLSVLCDEAHSGKIILSHVSSVGEYLQLLPVVEQLKATNPELKFYLSFFSPSLFFFLEGRPHPFAKVFSFPGDSKSRVRNLLTALRPRALIFSKYDLWPNLILEARKAEIPLYLISATLTKDSMHLGRFTFFYSYLYSLFTGIFSVSNEDTARFKANSRVPSAIVLTTGDTRVSSVMTRVREEASKISPAIRDLVCKGGQPCLVVGSSWPKDEKLLFNALERFKVAAYGELPFIIWAPHEVSEAHIKNIEEGLNKLSLRSRRLSDVAEFSHSSPSTNNPPEHIKALVVDRIGYLVSLYCLGNVAFVGSGRGGVHNIMEPIQAGLPVFFGPRYHNAREAIDLLNLGAVKSVSTPEEACHELRTLLSNPPLAKERTLLGQKFLESQQSAAKYCADYIRKGIGDTHV